MPQEITLLAYSVLLLFVMIITASTLRTHLYTPKGLMLAFQNRENLPEPTAIAGRAERAAHNMMEGMLLFTPAVLGARAAGIADATTVLGAQMFLVARLVYFPVYLAGIPYLRTAVWSVSIVGIGMIVLQLV
jgi:uncharacterized MAPEG superfamily protein